MAYIEVKQISTLCKTRRHVTIPYQNQHACVPELGCMRVVIDLRPPSLNALQPLLPGLTQISRQISPARFLPLLFKIRGRIFICQNIFLTSPFEFFFSEFSTTWQHGLLPALRSQRCPHCTVAGSGTNISPPSNTTRKQARQKGKSGIFASLRPVETFMRACTRPTEAACCRNERFL